MSTPMFYPCNYGYVNATLSLDGIRSTMLVPTLPAAGRLRHPLPPGRCAEDDRRIWRRRQDRGRSHSKLTKQHDHIQDVKRSARELLKAQIQHFFERYKELEAGGSGGRLGRQGRCRSRIATSAERYAAK